jgi:2-dehydropantoate 2-reductase
MSQSSSLRRICVFGAGAIGGALAARLARAAEVAETQISIVARGLHLAAIRKTGLRLRQSNETVPLTAHVRATDDPATLGPQDLVFTSVKGHQLAEAARGIGALLGSETRVVTILNGIPWWYFHADPGKHGGERLPLLDPDGALWDLVGPQRVIGGIAYHGAEVTAPGHVHLTSEGRFVLGEPNGDLSHSLAAIAAVLEQAGWRVTQTDRIRDDIWAKLLGNAAFNPVSTLTRAHLVAMIDDPEVCRIVASIMSEVLAVAQSLGARIATSVPERIAQARRMGPIRSSMLQDFLRGRSLEITPLLDVVATLGAMTDVQTPTLQMISGLVRLLARAPGAKQDADD